MMLGSIRRFSSLGSCLRAGAQHGALIIRSRAAVVRGGHPALATTVIADLLLAARAAAHSSLTQSYHFLAASILVPVLAGCSPIMCTGR